MILSSCFFVGKISGHYFSNLDNENNDEKKKPDGFEDEAVDSEIQFSIFRHECLD